MALLVEDVTRGRGYHEEEETAEDTTMQ